MKRLVITLILVLGLSAIGCQKEPRETHVESITISASSVTIDEGETYTLTATVSPDNASNKKILWTTSDASIASVDNGKVSAIKEGKATITSKSDDGGKTATCQITVNKKIVAVSGVSLDKECIELSIGDETTLSATVKPDNATDKSVSWKSSDEAIALVTDGKVKALKKGNAIITVTTFDGNKTASCSVNVNEKIIHVESVSLDITSVTLNVGDKATLVATVLPENSSDKRVEWSSNNEDCVSVADGTIKAIKVGTAAITAKSVDGGIDATCSVTVNPGEYPLIKKISWSPSFVTLSFTYDTYKRITKAEGKYEGEQIEITLNYDDYSDGDGSIIMNAFYGDELLTMKDGLCVSKSNEIYEYENNHISRWDDNYDYYWTGNLLTSIVYHDYPGSAGRINTMEYGAEDNPFAPQQFNMTYFLCDDLAMDLAFLFGLCGPEPDKLMTKISSSKNSSYDTFSYEYDNGVITKIYRYFENPSENTKETDIITIEYY